MADTYDPSIDQPMPTSTDGQDIQSLVMADIAARREVGIERYGTPLQAFNGRDALRDLYDELLDAACYARQLIEERTPIVRPYMFVHEAIGLFLEYRDTHGHDEVSARHLAAQEAEEGATADIPHSSEDRDG